MSTRLGHSIGAAAATLAIAIAFSGVALGHTTAGNATPANDGWHPWSSNGCSWVPDKGSYFNFLHACKHHDGCYQGFPRKNKPTYWASRWQCDSWFLYDMQASCRWRHGSQTNTSKNGRRCMQRAADYHYGVRKLARKAYKGPKRLNN